MAEAIVEARKHAGLTQRELGERLGISTSLLAKWEQGHRAPAIEWVTELDRALGSDLVAIAPVTGPRRGPKPLPARSAPRPTPAPARRPATPAPQPTRPAPASTPVAGPVVVLQHDGGAVVLDESGSRTATVIDPRSWGTLTTEERERLVGSVVLGARNLHPEAVADLVALLSSAPG